MPKLLGPMFSIAAYGTLAGSVTYQVKRIGMIAKANITPHIAITNLLLTKQSLFRLSIQTYQGLSWSMKTAWHWWAVTYTPNWSGFNAFQHYYLYDLNRGISPDHWISEIP